MRSDNVDREVSVEHWVQLIQDNEEEIESRQQGVWESYVLLWPPRAIVLSVHRVGSSENGASSVQ
jgi:hypothetical protein